MPAEIADVRRTEPEFRAYTSAPEGDDWEYELDEGGISYSRRSLWPFARRLRDRKPAKTVPAGVRLAPNSAYQAWGASYVLAYPDEEGRTASISFYVHVRPQGQGWIVGKCHGRLDLDTWEASLDAIPAGYEEDARRLLDRIAAFVRASVEERDAGKRRPVTAHDRWIARGGDRA